MPVACVLDWHPRGWRSTQLPPPPLPAFHLFADAMPGPGRPSSAAGILALLGHDNASVQGKALEKLFPVVDVFWAEIAEYLEHIEELSEDAAFGKRELASSVASKCYYHLEEYDDALRLALGAGEYFDSETQSQYTDTMLARCIDFYVKQRRSSKLGGSASGGSPAPGGAGEGEEDASRDLMEKWAQVETIVDTSPRTPPPNRAFKRHDSSALSDVQEGSESVNSSPDELQGQADGGKRPLHLGPLELT